MRIAAVVGARPNFVKIAALAASARRQAGIQMTLIHTGQHYDRNMSDSFFEDLDIPRPDVNLNVPPGDAAHQLADMIDRLATTLAEAPPDLVLVVGDVTSTLAGALVAAKTGVRVAHVEAGLRSFDRTMPEELNRILTDSVADYCFTTEPAANENLLREGVSAARIHYVGNVMIDTLFRARERCLTSRIVETLGLVAGAFAVLTLHRPSNVDDPGVLHRLLEALAPIVSDLPVVFPVHPRTRRPLEAALRASGVASKLRLIDPLGYLDFIQLMATARCVLTDSGGIQEETTALHIPCLTLRTSTERPITTTHGTNRIVGLDAHAIATAWRQIQDGGWPIGSVPPLWDGTAADRIVEVLQA